MSLATEDEALIVRYFLGELPPDDRRLLEQRYFLDDLLFEARYLQSQQLSERVESARLLMQVASAAPQASTVAPARGEQVSLGSNTPSRRSIFGPSILERLRE